jgi:DNA-binding transcriptional regulator YiaG
MDSHMDGSSLVSSLDLISSTAAASEPTPHPTFACQLKDMRQRFGFKQLWLANAVGCTDAAVSFWETGKRVPQAHILLRMVEALTNLGASPKEMVTFYGSWREEKLRAALASAQAPRRRAAGEGPKRDKS